MLAPDLPSIPLNALQSLLRSDLPYLFISLALLAVALVGIGVVFLRRDRDLLLLSFSLFAGLYGARLLLQREIFDLIFYKSSHLQTWRDALDYIVPVPGMVYFYRGGFLTRVGKYAAMAVAVVGVILFALVLVFGSRQQFHFVNNVVIIAALLQFLYSITWRGRDDDRDVVELRAIRYGLFAFIALALSDNIFGLFRLGYRLEPFGFLAFIGCLGYVTATRTFAREQRLLSIEKELDIARRIQMSILPGDFPPNPRLRVAAHYIPMTSVAGDFYDFVLAEENRAAILVADVAGHGVPAALIASMVKLAAASQRGQAHHPAKFLSGMNAALVGNTQTQFVTAACIYFDLQSHEVRYSAAGHPPLLRLRDTHVESIEENGLMLAAFDFAAYEQKHLPLQAGDRFLLYTDGVLEAANGDDVFFGADRLHATLRETSALNATQAADAITTAVRAWSPNQEDDITVIVCDVV